VFRDDQHRVPLEQKLLTCRLVEGTVDPGDCVDPVVMRSPNL
jgi:hypothetical protein